MMYRTDPDGIHQPIPPMDVTPPNMCQPPVDAIRLAKQLSFEELQDVVQTMIQWAPEAFERGLSRVSFFRQIRGWYSAKADSSANKVVDFRHG
jgi:hypothetical protein